MRWAGGRLRAGPAAVTPAARRSCSALRGRRNSSRRLSEHAVQGAGGGGQDEEDDKEEGTGCICNRKRAMMASKRGKRANEARANEARANEARDGLKCSLRH